MEIYRRTKFKELKTCNLLHVHDIYVAFYRTNVFCTQFIKVSFTRDTKVFQTPNCKLNCLHISLIILKQSHNSQI